MKRFLFLFLGLLCSCATLEKDLVTDLVNNKSPLHRCEVEGFVYPGIDADLQTPQVLKVMMVHGVGLHHPGYSRRIQENLANNIGLDVRSRLAKNVTLLDPEDSKTKIGNLRVTFWQNADARKNMLFYELTWSMITTPEKQIIAFDTTEQYTKFRVPFNNMMKEFLDNTLPDPLFYLVDKNGLILHSNEQALCWMLKTNWSDIPNNKAEVCRISTAEEVKGFERQKLAFITHSLGSEILMDAMVNTSNRISAAQNNISPALSPFIRQLQNKEITIFMLANQLPILQIGHPLPPVHNQIEAYCSPQGSKYSRRIFKGTNIVAFSDPNDILSYAIPQNFADTYIDSRICPRVTNVSVNVAPEISAFGLGIVNPVEAHTNYDNSPKVINLITRGTDDFYSDQELDKQCHFVELKDDRKMQLK